MDRDFLDEIISDYSDEWWKCEISKWGMSFRFSLNTKNLLNWKLKTKIENASNRIREVIVRRYFNFISEWEKRMKIRKTVQMIAINQKECCQFQFQMQLLLFSHSFCIRRKSSVDLDWLIDLRMKIEICNFLTFSVCIRIHFEGQWTNTIHLLLTEMCAKSAKTMLKNGNAPQMHKKFEYEKRVL